MSIRTVILFMLYSLVSSSVVAGPDGVPGQSLKQQGKLVYLVSDLRIPFWDIMWRGIREEAAALGYGIEVHSAENSRKNELQHLVWALREEVDGIIVSPISSSTCVTILKHAAKEGVPVVISDIGTDDGQYVSYISSDNHEGAYRIGQVLASALKERGWEDSSVGIIAIPQKRLNGQARTAGFMKAMREQRIKGADIKQQSDFSDQETYRFSLELIHQYPDLRALWLQGSDRYGAALRAIKDAGKKGEILLVTFDAEPEFLKMIPQGRLVGAAMQQPFLMGQHAVEMMDRHLQGGAVERNIQLPVLAISQKNIAEKTVMIKRNVLGLAASP